MTNVVMKHCSENGKFVHLSIVFREVCKMAIATSVILGLFESSIRLVCRGV